MEYRYLGKTGLKVSVIGIGARDFSDTSQEDYYVQYTTESLKLGINIFDTAESYSSGLAEEILGKVLKRVSYRREEIVICTKIFWTVSPLSNIYETKPNLAGLSRKHVLEGMKNILARLQLSYVDIAMCHRPDPSTPIEEVCRAFNWLINKNYCFYWGTSEWSPTQIMEAYKVCDEFQLIRPCTEELEYNIIQRDRMEVEHRLLFDDYSMGSLIFGSLKGGILAGRYENGIPQDSKFAKDIIQMISYYQRCGLQTEEGNNKMKELLNSLSQLASSINTTTPIFCIAWCLVNKNVSSVLIGVTKIERLEEMVQAIEVSKRFSPELIEKLENILRNKPKSTVNFRNLTK